MSDKPEHVTTPKIYGSLIIDKHGIVNKCQVGTICVFSPAAKNPLVNLALCRTYLVRLPDSVVSLAPNSHPTKLLYTSDTRLVFCDLCTQRLSHMVYSIVTNSLTIGHRG